MTDGIRGGGSRYERNEERGKKIGIGIDIEKWRGDREGDGDGL